MELLDQNPTLRRLLVIKTSPTATDLATISEATHLLEPLIKAYSPFRDATLERRLNHELRQHSMCAEITPLGSDDPTQGPLVIRRRPGGEFVIRTFPGANDHKPITLIEIGDTPPTEANYASIRKYLQERHERRYHTNISTILSVELERVISSITQQSEDLLRIAPSPVEIRKSFLQDQFPQIFSNKLRTSLEAVELGRNIVSQQARELSMEFQIRTAGHDETIEAWAGDGRDSYDDTSYTHTEKSSFMIFQCGLLFQDLYSAELSDMTRGADKASALLRAYPVKTLERDQLLCEAADYPSLSHLEDMKAVQLRILDENDIEILHLLREGFKNQGLVQTAEVRLFEICMRDTDAFLAHPCISG